MAVRRSKNVKPRAKIANVKKNIEKPTKEVLLVAHEIKLAKILAGNNQVLRDRTLKKLKKWLDMREVDRPFDEDEFMRLWKGLFYYMWMSDKPLFQEECANNIAKLVEFKNANTALLFFKCFLQTMINEWFGIDNLRLDKFLMLVRRVLRQTLTVLKNFDWDLEILKNFQNLLAETVLDTKPSNPLSLSMHVTEIYLEEVSKVSKGLLTEEQVLELVRPFAVHLASSNDARQSLHVKAHIFRYLMRQSDLGIEHEAKFNAWKQLGFPGGNIEAMEKIELDGEIPEEFDEEAMQNSFDNVQLDPRAGKVHVYLEQLKFDPSQIADLLENLRFELKTNTKSRRALTALAKQFHEMATGIYPLGMKKVFTKPVNDGPSLNMKSSLRRLQNFEKQISGTSKKAQESKKKSRRIRAIVKKELEKYQNLDNGQKVCNMDDFIAKSEEGILNPALVKFNNKKKNVRKEKKVDSLDEFVARSEGGILESVSMKNNIKKKSNILAKNKPIMKKEKKMLLSEGVKKSFERNSGIWEVADLEVNTKTPLNSTDWQTEKSPMLKPSKRNKSSTDHIVTKKIKLTKDADLPTIEEFLDNSPKKSILRGKMSKRGGEIAKNNDFLTPIKGGSQTPTSLVKNPFSTPLSLTKKVKIDLNLNRSQDHLEYHQSLVSSPGIPYDSNRKPTKPLLKSRISLPNSINPFYKR